VGFQGIQPSAVPEAFGLDEHAIERAERLATLGYVALACDLHGEGRVVDDLPEAMARLQPLFDNPARTRARAAGALLTLAARPEVDAARIAAIGFCFPMSLELARSGAEIRAAVGFHTTLATKAPSVDPGAINARMLVCIGADDPFIPANQRAEFETEMRNVGADWQIVRPDGVFDLDARYTLETDSGKLIYVVNRGMRHGPPEEPAKVYFRSVPVFETAAPELQWLTRSIFVGTGERYPSDVVIRFWRIE